MMTNTEIRRGARGSAKEPLTPGKLAFKVLLTILNFHIKLNSTDLSLLPTEALEEVHTRLRNLRELVDKKFKEADRELRTR